MVAEVLEVADVTEVAVGDLVHTGTPHQEETVLNLASSLGATYPLVRLPTTERPERALFISVAAVALQAVHDAEMKLGDARVRHRPRPGQAQAGRRAGATVVAAGFYQGGAGNVRLGEEFHHNRLSLIASISTRRRPPTAGSTSTPWPRSRSPSPTGRSRQG